MAQWTLLDCSLGRDSTLIRTVFSSTGRKGTEVIVPGASLVSTWAIAGHKNDIQEFQEHLLLNASGISFGLGKLFPKENAV